MKQPRKQRFNIGINPELQEMVDALKQQSKKMEELVQQACDGSDKAVIAVKGLVSDVIALEKKIDRLKETFIEKLYTQKGFLPNIQKNDYLFITENIDEIADEIEIVARQFQIYDYTFPSSVKNDFFSLAIAVNNTVASLAEQVIYLFQDFKIAGSTWNKVQEERRVAREVSWSLLREILGLEVDHKHFLMLRALVKSLIAVADKAEDFSDSINALAVKYLSLD
jgi:predicted phosphate transport protein (TIGR00153 family)